MHSLSAGEKRTYNSTAQSKRGKKQGQNHQPPPPNISSGKFECHAMPTIHVWEASNFDSCLPVPPGSRVPPSDPLQHGSVMSILFWALPRVFHKPPWVLTRNSIATAEPHFPPPPPRCCTCATSSAAWSQFPSSLRAAKSGHNVFLANARACPLYEMTSEGLKLGVPSWGSLWQQIFFVSILP